MSENDPIIMFNALWFKPDGGAEMYREYLNAAGPMVAKNGGKLVSPRYIPDEAVIGEFDADLIFFVEYPSWDHFLQFANSPEYLAVRHLREDAIDKSLLIRCHKG
jgi:uncharacterized protein (DUF1330 family)